jgi:hypothetical protein
MIWSRLGVREDSIVPFAMKGSPFNVQAGHVRVAGGDTGGVGAGIQITGHLEACRGGGRCDEAEDHSVGAQRDAAPVLADEGEEPVLNLGPVLLRLSSAAIWQTV